MAKEKGSLSIHSENIFPIIKKWLYSDHDIFIRELVSNACDAITKVKRLNTLGEADLAGNDDFKVQVTLDKEAKTLTISDNGIGMTDEEIKKYINQIAFSGAEDFIEKYKDKGDADQIIGHFGLGFYSAFMVADRVEIHTLSHAADAKPVRWECDGGTEFEMQDGDRTARGTDIVLHLGEEGTEFLQAHKVQSTLNRYCSFMPYPVFFEDAQAEPKKDEDGNVIVEEPTPLNETQPLYLKRPNECTDDEYKDFFRSTFQEFKEPLFWIHLNMDYPFNLKGILYFPKLNTEFDTVEGQIKLYNNQVFVANNIKEVIPEFLLLLKGVIDCPDLPLNVSRSFLQNDGFVQKISDYITKKVADKLNGMFKTEREAYEGFWDDIHPFIKYGALKDEKFNEKIAGSMIYKTTADTYLTAEEYRSAYGEHVDKTIYYTTDRQQQAQYIHMLKDHKVEAVLMEHSIDQAFLSMVEAKKEDVQFKRVDSDLSDLLKEEDTIDEETSKAQLEKLEDLYKRVLGKEKVHVELQTLKSENVASVIILPEDSRRMQDMMRMYSMGGMDMGAFPSEETLVLNRKHPLVQYTLDHQGETSELGDMIAQQLYDMAMMSHKPLEPQAMTAFIQRTNDIMKQVIDKK